MPKIWGSQSGIGINLEKHVIHPLKPLYKFSYFCTHLLIFHLDLLLFVPYDTFSQLFTIEISSLAQANHFPLVLRIEEALIHIPSIYHYQYQHYNLINNACIITYHSILVNIT